MQLHLYTHVRSHVCIHVECIIILYTMYNNDLWCLKADSSQKIKNIFYKLNFNTIYYEISF